MEVRNENAKVECELDILSGVPTGKLQIDDSCPFVSKCPSEPRLTIPERLQNRLVNGGSALVYDLAWGFHSSANV